MHVKPRVRPGEHALRRLDIDEFPPHEQTQHRPSKGLGECGDIVQRQRDERAVRPEPTIGHQQMQVRVPGSRDPARRNSTMADTRRRSCCFFLEDSSPKKRHNRANRIVR